MELFKFYIVTVLVKCKLTVCLNLRVSRLCSRFLKILRIKSQVDFFEVLSQETKELVAWVYFNLWITSHPASWSDFPFLIVSSTVFWLKGSLQTMGVLHSSWTRWIQWIQEFHLSWSSFRYVLELELLELAMSTASQKSFNPFTASTRLFASSENN